MVQSDHGLEWGKHTGSQCHYAKPVHATPSRTARQVPGMLAFSLEAVISHRSPKFIGRAYADTSGGRPNPGLSRSNSRCRPSARLSLASGLLRERIQQHLAGNATHSLQPCHSPLTLLRFARRAGASLALLDADALHGRGTLGLTEEGQYAALPFAGTGARTAR